MDRAESIRRLTGILRQRLLHGSDRPLDPDAPLTQAGLDSLGLVEFMSTVESEFGLEVPDRFWSQPGLRLRDFADWLDEPRTSPPPRPS